MVQVIPAGSPANVPARRSWDIAATFDTKHLLRVYQTGETDLDGEPVVFAALELPDDDVGEVLRQRPLEVDEARSLTEGTAKALAFLHEHNLCHGEVTATNVYIAGEDIKLGVDTLAPGDPESRASDMMQFGLLLLRAITGSADREAVKKLPSPFAAIVKGCISSPDREWTARRVLDELEGRRPVVVMQPPVSRPAGWKLAVLGAGVAAAAGIGYVALKGPSRTLVETPVAREAAPLPKIVDARPAPAQATPAKPTPSKAAPSKPAPSKSAARAEAKHDADWAVVAATYASQSAAEHRAETIGKQARGLKAHVYPRGGSGNRYYVLLGSSMTRAEADRVRDKARRSGAPRDTYVTKLRVE